VWVAVFSFLCSGLLTLLVGRNLVSWVESHSAATEEIVLGNYDVRIGEKRPDEFGRLSDRFNDMALALARARVKQESYGQILPADLHYELERFPGLGGESRDITVMFADIRGFTRRSAGQPPEKVVSLLNRFFTLVYTAVEAQGGYMNKFLG